LLSRSGAIALDDEAVTVDVALLETALAEGTTEGLERVAELCKGEFLSGLNLDETGIRSMARFRMQSSERACCRGVGQTGRSADI